MRVDVEQLLSWFISGTVALSVYLCGQRKTIGWPIGLAAQVMWGTYAFLTHHWGFIVGPVLLGPLFAHNWYVWHREDLERTREQV
jgi:hypothetical protein